MEINALEILKKSDNEIFNKLRKEAEDSWNKRQVFRTETEMRLSVLNDGRHPTPASKYWQSVREQGVFFENLVHLSFNYRKNLARLKYKEKKLKTEKDEFKQEILQIDIDEKRWILKQQEQEAHHRIRELEHWSRIKFELDDGSFDTTDPNTHQNESLPLRFEHDLQSLTQGTPSSEVRNVLGLVKTVKNNKLNTAQKHLTNNKQIGVTNGKKEKNSRRTTR